MPTLVQNGYNVFTDTDGQPLEDGYIYIGQSGLNPINNPIPVFWDAALTKPATRIRTKGGYPSNNGTPGRLYVPDEYSISVQDKNESTVYTQATALDFFDTLKETVVQDLTVNGDILQNSGSILAREGENVLHSLGNASIGGAGLEAQFSHIEHKNDSNAGFTQFLDGKIIINTADGKEISFRIDDTEVGKITTTSFEMSKPTVITNTLTVDGITSTEAITADGGITTNGITTTLQKFTGTTIGTGTATVTHGLDFNKILRASLMYFDTTNWIPLANGLTISSTEISVVLGMAFAYDFKILVEYEV